MQLITKGTYGDAAHDVVLEFERTIAKTPGTMVVTASGHELHRRAFWKMLRLTPGAPFASSRRADECFAVLMSPGEIVRCIPSVLTARKRHLYCFDVFPQYYDYIDTIVRKCSIDTLFVSSEQGARAIAARGVPARCVWVPEAIDVSEYRASSVRVKDIDVVQIGRRYDAYHNQIVGPLSAAKRTYLYQPTPGEMVFTTRDAFVDGLARAKISICVPSSITHPGRAGGVSTMTVRYLQSMASKCLLVGRMPEDMRPLFDYEPIIEIDELAPAAQLLEILDNYSKFMPLVERNYATVCNRHTWAVRWQDIQRVLRSPGAPDPYPPSANSGRGPER